MRNFLLVERMLELNKRKHHVAAAFRPPDRSVRLKADATDLEREIAATDAEIDELVYDLPARRGGPAAGRALRHHGGRAEDH